MGERNKLSYKQILARVADDNKRRRRYTVMAIKITVCALALCLAVLCVLFVVDLVSDGLGNGKKNDKTPPTITLVEGDCIYMYAGETVSFRDKVSARDDSGEKPTLTFDSRVNVNTPGAYSVIYTATDAAGNSTSLTVSVVVTKKDYTYDMLMSRIEALALRLGITSDMSKQEQVFAVYNYVNSPDKSASSANIFFSDESNVPDIQRANWQNDWIEEAILTIDKINEGDGEGDCYSYYSVSKAFFEYLGIEHVGIQRDNSNIPDGVGTHFWLIVNIGNSSNPNWYYYDATRLKYTFAKDNTNNACLITLKKLRSYGSNLSYDFYSFDPTDYPTASTRELS